MTTTVLRLALRLAAVLAVAGPLAACQRMDDAAFGNRVHAYLMEHPEVIREVADKAAEKEQLASIKASTDAIGKYRAQLERDPRDFVANPTGKVTVVEFFDYRCTYCKLAAPEVVKLIQDNPDVRFVFKQFPIFGGVSDSAAKIALTREAKAKGVQLYQALMSEKALDEAALDRHLAELGIDPKAVRQEGEHPMIERQLLDAHGLAEALKVDGTPAFIVGDTFIPGADMNALRVAIAKAKAGTQAPASGKS
jgi:protein-disulfide isomerase